MRPNDTALVTGASAGLGEGFARRLAAGGLNLVLCARRRDRLDALASELERAHDVQVKVLDADLGVPGAALDLAQRIGPTRVDWLINNAGFGLRGDFVDLDHAGQTSMIRLNVEALTSLTHLLLPSMLQQKRGGVLNVASTAAFQPGPHMAVYYASKAYVLSFTEALRVELASSGVHICCLAPGATRTEFGEVSGMGSTRIFKSMAGAVDTVVEAGIDGLIKNRRLVIPGLANKLTPLGARLAPRGLIAKLVGRMQRPQ